MDRVVIDTNIFISSFFGGVPREIIERQLVHFDKADPAYGAGVRKALGI